MDKLQMAEVFPISLVDAGECDYGSHELLCWKLDLKDLERTFLPCQGTSMNIGAGGIPVIQNPWVCCFANGHSKVGIPGAMVKDITGVLRLRMFMIRQGLTISRKKTIRFLEGYRT